MHVIFMAPNFPPNQRRFVAGLKNVGARVTGLGDTKPEYLDSEIRGMIDAYVYVPTLADEDAVFDAVRKIQRAGPWVHHFEATIEAHMITCAKVRERAGIPGLPFEVIERCRDKFKMKEYLSSRGVPCARQAAVSNAGEARAAARRIGYPLILKPRTGAGAAGTYKIDNDAQLERAIAESGLERGGFCSMEQYLLGHEGFFDTLTVNGQVLFEGICHYYPNVLEAMRNRDVAGKIAVTNRVEMSSYDEVRALGRKVIRELGVTTSATHMEWFFGPEGLKFSEIGARPPGVHLWDIYCEANDFDLYTEWARAVCWGSVDHKPSRRFAGGLISIRPSADGVVKGYSGVEEIQAKYGQYIFKAFLPPVGARTQPIEAGYRANAWMYLRHPDYDGVRAMMDDIERTLKMYAG